MTQRERLIELLIEADMQLKYPSEEECERCDLHDVGRCDMVHMADYLLANGVIVLPCRCCECESFREGLCDNEHIGAMVFRMKREETDFCSYGERKGGDE